MKRESGWSWTRRPKSEVGAGGIPAANTSKSLQVLRSYTGCEGLVVLVVQRVSAVVGSFVAPFVEPLLYVSHQLLSEGRMPERHQLVLDFIKAYIRLHGVAPSYLVIAKGIGLKSKIGRAHV